MKLYFTAGMVMASLFLKAQEVPGPVPDSHAPIGVMGDHMHLKGEWMFSYRFMHMSMTDNLKGTESIDPEVIVTTEPNYFAGQPMMPPNLRVVPIDMGMNMHMVGLMYAPSDWITLMAMGMYISNSMTHITFQGGMGTTRLGEFTTKSTGLGDSRITALVKLLKSSANRLHLNLGISIPTGSLTEEDRILTPMNTQPTVRLPYPMQLGSGTFDLMPGFTFSGGHDRAGWGAQLMGTFRLDQNSEGYALGNAGQLSGWGSYRLAPWLSSSLRLTGFTQGMIDGLDDNIAAPVQTADPTRQGGERADFSLGLNSVARTGFLKNHRLAMEWCLPVYQNLNGPQLKTSWVLILGWQYSI